MNTQVSKYYKIRTDKKSITMFVLSLKAAVTFFLLLRSVLLKLKILSADLTENMFCRFTVRIAREKYNYAYLKSVGEKEDL